MGIEFNADEVFEMAERMERNGAEFYRRAAEGDIGSGCKQKLLELAEMEAAHEKAFAALRVELSAGEKGPTVFDPDDEVGLYLEAMADGFALDLHGHPEQLVADKGLKDILETAIGLEKDAIIFYLGLRDMVPHEAGKDKVDWIIGQEKGHIVTLSAQLRALK